MSEDSIHRTTLVPRAASQLAQVLTAGRQLAIAARLQDDNDRDRLVALLKRIPSDDAMCFISYSQPLSADMIERFEERWSWDALSENKSLPWSLELIERFEDRWYWQGLANNEGLPWSIELLEHFGGWWEYMWDLTINKGLPWSLELIEHFESQWYWGGLSKNESLPWSIELIEYFEKEDSDSDWDGDRLSETVDWNWDGSDRENRDVVSEKEGWYWNELSRN